MVSGRNITRPPDFDAGDFLALNPVSECALGDAEDLRRLGNAQQGLDHFK